jgi:hypothetical protein
MIASKEQTITPRHQMVALLAQKFASEYKEVMQHYQPEQQLELTEHLLLILSFLKHCVSGNESETYPELVAKENLLLTKYGKLLEPYKNAHFEKYFDTDIVLTEKDIITTEEFNRLPSTEQGLSFNETLDFVKICSNVLYKEREFLILRKAPSLNVKDDTVKELLTVKQEADNSKEFTKARQLLTLHYLLSSGFGIEPRGNTSVSSLARFAHLITGTSFTSLQNSELYKKYRLMPNYKKGLELISDLQFIRTYFADLGLTEAVNQIDAEIRREKIEMMNKKKK